MNLTKVLLLSFIISLSYKTNAQTNSKIIGKSFDNRIRLNYMEVKMPNTRKEFTRSHMGLGGAHYQIPVSEHFYVGGVMSYALFGDQGGLFTLGVEGGVNLKLFNNFYLDGNLHIGGGGGYRVLINDGSFVNPNIGIEYKKQDYSIGIQYSYFDFISGDVRDDAVSFYIQIPNKIRSTSYRNANQIVSKENLSDFFRKKASKSSLIVRFDFFNPKGKSRKDNGNPLSNTLSVLGFEYQKYLNTNTFLYAHTDAIYKGLRSGFMDFFVGGGFHPITTKYINITTKFGIGAAGGRIFPEGGITMYPSIGMELKPFQNITLATHFGYLRALDGDFEANTYGLGLKYNVESNGTKSFDDKKENDTFKIIGWTMSVQNQTYLDVPKTDDLEGKLITDLQSLAINFGYDFNKFLYGFGEASFTYEGRSGGYAHGMVGLGCRSPRFLNNKFRANLELGIGVAGGGGIDAKEGLVIRPNLGMSYDLNEKFAIYIAGGKFLTPDGTINSNNFNIGVSFNIASLIAK